MSSNNKKKSKVKLIGLFSVCVLAGLILAVFIQTRDPAVEPISVTPVVPLADLQETKTKAEAGDADAQNLLGDMYLKCAGTPQDYKEAAKWYRLAADQNNASAQAHLGELYEAGQGVVRDEAQAAQWYQRAAELGNVAAQYSLAVLYVTGRGLALNDTEAVRWYRMAAERGYDLAQYNLGERSIAGKSMPKHKVEAYKWLSLAAVQGLPDAEASLNTLKGSMTSDQIKEGKQRAASFVATKGPVVKP